jgi:hypothetical protein
MTDHTHDDVTLVVTLDVSALCRAARLGGLPIALDEQPMDEGDATLELIKFFARRGILTAIDDSFDRHSPAHYPEDVEDELWQTSGPATGGFAHVWRGTVTW